MDTQKNKDNDLTETLRVTIKHLETQLAGERKEKGSKESSLQQLNKDYGVVLRHSQKETKVGYLIGITTKLLKKIKIFKNFQSFRKFQI